eukprot:COSAG02_NODE_67074_length_254_cov_0.490323_1_plen_47_part_01
MLGDTAAQTRREEAALATSGAAVDAAAAAQPVYTEPVKYYVLATATV